MNESNRVSRNIMTVDILDSLVSECLGTVSVLALIGRARSGKTWAATDWLSQRTDDLTHVAYVDCKGIGFGGKGSISIAGIACDLSWGQYPQFVLDGIDVVIVDEGQCNLNFLRTLIAHTAPAPTASAHRLVVLLIQDLRVLDELTISKNDIRCYSTAGLPIKYPIRP